MEGNRQKVTTVDILRTDRESGAKLLEREYKARLCAVARRLGVDETEAEALAYRTIDEAVRARILNGEKPIEGRFAATLPDDAFEKAAEALGDTARCEEDVLSYISFPPVAEKFFADRAAAEEKRCRYSIEAVED